MKPNAFICSLFGALALLTGCEVPFDTELQTLPPGLVVEGLLVDSVAPQYVRLSRSQAFTDNSAPPVVTGAAVTVEDLTDATTYPYTEAEPGLYRSAPFTGIVGHVYRLTVVQNGETFTAVDTLKRVMALDSVTYEFVEEGQFVDEAAYYLTTYSTELEGLGDFIEYRFFRNGAPNDYTLENIRAFQDLRVDGNAIVADWQGVFPYAVGDTYAVEIRSLSSNGYNYFTDLTNSGNAGSPFGGPPYTPRTNLSGPSTVYGFFVCSAVSRLEGVIE
ncbi:MAG: DUF4249 domain-containing protein [Bacteroidia bacterium]|nr:DUF4249 domain-containing protein [Bacteroidia bacterium]